MHTKPFLRSADLFRVAPRSLAWALTLAPVLSAAILLGVAGTVAAQAQTQAQAPQDGATAASPAESHLNVVGTVPLDGDALAGQIVVFFDGELAPLPAGADGSSPAPFGIEPAVEGERRVGRNYVAFRSGQFQPNTVYRLTLSEALQSTDGRRVNPERRVLTFATFVFEPQQVWTIESTAEREVIGVSFPIAVDRQSLGERLTVTAPDGSAVAYTLEAGTSDNAVRVAIPSNSQFPVQLGFGPGVAAAGADLKLAQPRTLQYPPNPILQVTEINWEDFTPEAQQFRLTFSSGVTAEALRQHLTIRQVEDGAEVPYTVVDDSGEPPSTQRVELHLADTSDVKLEVTVSEGLAGLGRTVLPAAHVQRLDRAEEPLRIDEAWWGQEDRAGLELVFRLSNAVELQDLQEHLQMSPALPELKVQRKWENTFGIQGIWDSKKTYRMTLTPGLRFGGVGVTTEALTREMTTEEVPSYLGFGHEGKFYFPRQGGLTLPLESRNLTKARVNLYRLFPSNIVIALQQMGQYDGRAAQALSWSEALGSQEVNLRIEPDRLTATPLDLNALFPDKQGVFVLQAEPIREPDPDAADGEEPYYYTPGPNAKLVLMTQIGLLAHWRDSELALFAHDLYTLAPLPLVTVTVYSDKNQLLARGNTDARGMLHLAAFDPSLGVPKVAVAEKDGDYTFLELEPRPDDLKAYEPDLPPYNKAGYDAFIYADRELYRPGEPVHLRWIVRTDYGTPLKNVPLLVTVVKPNGRDLLSKPVVLSSFGTGDLDLLTQRAYPTGLYTVKLTVPGSEAALGSYTFHLEDFVPNRMKAEVTAPEGVWVAGTEYEIGLNAQHLFGAPAADRRAEALVVFRRDGFAHEAWKEYTFNNDSDYQPEYVSLGESRTDEAGNATFRFNWTPPREVTFPMKAVVVGRVYELGGRAVVGRVERSILPSAVALGVTASAPVDGRGIEVHAAAVNPDGTPAGLAKVKVTLEKQAWNYYVRRYYSHYESNWSDSFEVVETREVDMQDGRGSTVFAFDDYGYYRVRVHSDATPQYSTLSFYAYGERFRFVDSARPSLIKITTDKPEYNVGEDAIVRIESPFDGQGILVVQGEEIQQMLPVTIQGGRGEVPLHVDAEQFPNVWIEVTVIHTVRTDRTQVYPFSSFAMAGLTVRDPAKKLAVTFPGLEEEIRPLTPLQVPVEVRDHAGNPVAAEVTVAVVDEGIHSITDYRNPDPYAWLSRMRRPDFRRAHYYDKVVYDFSKPSPGGDMGSDLAKRASAVEENWIRPLALWSGPVVTDANGRATVTFDMPEFNGQVRIVAVAAGEAALGAGAEDTFVRRPYMLRTSLPRFLLPGDTAVLRGTIFNTTGAPARATVSWSVAGAVVEGQGEQTFELAPHQEAGFAAPITAGTEVGQGEVRWTTVVTDAQGREVERFQETDLLPVRPPASYQTAHELVVLAPGESREFRNERFVDDAQAAVEIMVGANPALRLKDALKFVVGYPYGCVEQSVSRLLPMYLLRQNQELIASALEQDQRLEGYLQAGISRLFSMQVPGGGLAMWPGGGEPYPYGSIYALHFLTLVKNDRQFEMPLESFRLLQNYVREIAGDWSSGDAPSDLYRRAYATYVLALDGDMEAIRQIERFDAVTLPTAARYLLAAALARNTRDADRVKLYLQQTPSEPYTAKEQGGTLNSDVRNQAVRLLALRQMNGDATEIAQLANELTEFLVAHRYGNTQETAFIIAALAEYLGELAQNVGNAAATVSGSKEGSIAGLESFRAKQEGPGATFTVANTGQAPIFVSVTTAGVPTSLQTEVIQEGMTVTRSFLTNRAEPFPAGPFTHGDSYVVKIALTCKGEFENVIVTDLLPAGLEIENPRLDPTAMPAEEFENMATPTHLEIRDDRLVLAYENLGAGTHRFYYVVRAVTPGQFTHPPVEAECMYDARFRARSEAGSAEVAPRP